MTVGREPGPEELQHRRRRRGARVAAVGIVLLLVSTWAVPMGIIYLAWDRAGTMELGPAQWATVAGGAVSLLLGALATIGGLRYRTAAGEPPNPEDEFWDHHGPLMDYDPGSDGPGRG